MRKYRKILCLMTVLFLAVTIFLCEGSGAENAVSFQIGCGEDCQTLSLWEQEPDRYYVFLPSYANMQHLRIRLNTVFPVSIHTVELEDGMDCTPFSEKVAYRFSCPAWIGSSRKEIVFLRSANVAAMYIETASGSMDYIHAEKGNQESGSVKLYLPDGRQAYAGALASIQGRGNYSWTVFEKKPYSISLMEEADLLGLGNGQKWILLANADDSSHVRNKVIYDFADRVGLEYSPDSDWVDLYLNGEYAGLYLLSERNEVHPERVNIGDHGSFLVSLERYDRIAAQNYPSVSTTAKQHLRVHYPENLSPDQLQALENTWQSLENAILSEDDTDPVSGKTWMQQIDLDSWVRKYLIEEVFGNGDACFISQFFYCDGNDGQKKIYAGPVWDYDHTMGSEGVWQLTEPNTLYANRYAVKDGLDTPWFHALYQKEQFFECMVDTYQRDFLPLLKGFLREHIEACTEKIAKAYAMDQIRWNLGDTGIQEKETYLLEFMEARTAFLSSLWIERTSFYTVKADNAKGNLYAYYAVTPGETLTALPELKDLEGWEFLGWYEVDSGEPFCRVEPVREDMELRAVWRAKPALWLGRLGKLMPLLLLLVLLPVVWGIGTGRLSLRRRRK